MTISRISFLPNFSFFKETTTSEDKINQIRDNLKKAHISQDSTDKLLHLVGEHPFMLSALTLFTKPTHSSRQCEEYYLHSENIAEYYCTWTNIGFFAVALYYQNLGVFSVAVFSALSHAIPFESLNLLDRITATYLFSTIIFNYPLLINNSDIMLAGLTTFTFGALGKLLSGNNPHIFASVFHSAWHLTAAYTLHKFYQTQANIPANVLADLFNQPILSILKSAIPLSLPQFCNSIAETATNVVESVSDCLTSYMAFRR